MAGFFASAAIAAAIVSGGASALEWHPADDWRDAPDPIASPYARKGGTIRFNGAQPPKSFNAYTDNNTYTCMTFALMYETLLSTDSETLDFAPALARRWAVSGDGNEFVFVLDERARWSDGRPVVAEDVKWTFDTVTDGGSDTGPYKMILDRFESPEVVDALTIRFRKKGGAGKDWRDLQHISSFYIMPRHYFAGRDFNKLDLVGAPVSGPYCISRAIEQVETEFARVKNWWRGDFPSCRHICNFDRIVMRYFVSNENAFEALKKRAIDVYPVYTARIMANETNGEKFDKNWILRRRVRNHNPIGYQGFAMNMRRWPFDDVRVRKAMAKLVDRETMNRTMMYGEYFLLNSYYTDLYDDEHPCANPLYLYDFEGARRLLAEAGFVPDPQSGRLVRDGRPFEFTFLTRSPGETKFLSLFHDALSRLGVTMHIETKDFAAWMRDMDSFSFDMTWAAMGASVFRCPEVQWLSSEADRRQSNNYTGFKSAEVDRIIEAEKSMSTMAERQEAYRAIDRLVAAECPMALLWQIREIRLLYWNKFGMPDTVLSRYGDEESVLAYWWYDEDKARELDEAVDARSFLPSVPLRVDFDEVVRARRAGEKGGGAR